MYAIANTEYVYFRSQLKNPEYLGFVLRLKSGYPLPISLQNTRICPVFLAKNGSFKGGKGIFFVRAIGGKTATDLESTS